MTTIKMCCCVAVRCRFLSCPFILSCVLEASSAHRGGLLSAFSFRNKKMAKNQKMGVMLRIFVLEYKRPWNSRRPALQGRRPIPQASLCADANVRAETESHANLTVRSQRSIHPDVSGPGPVLALLVWICRWALSHLRDMNPGRVHNFVRRP